MNTDIETGIKQIKENIAAALKRTLKTDKVTLLAATKTVPSAIINETCRKYGISTAGENRVQELLSKYEELDKENIDLQFIGKLQTNKVKYIIDKVSMIHSLDTLNLAKEIDKQAKKINKPMNVLVEINSGNEISKSGVNLDEVEDFILELEQFEFLKVRGLMTIGPIFSEENEYRELFGKVYEIFVYLKEKNLPFASMDYLSMGMSANYEIAIEEGANRVRLGSAIFGKRN